MSFPFKAGFGNLAKPDFTYLHSGNSAEKFPPAGGMGDWGEPQQARLSYKCYACVNAATGGAEHVTAVDVSESAIEMARANAARNGLEDKMDFLAAAVFDLLPQLEAAHEKPYDFIILDPPAFTKSRRTANNAEKGYKEINLRAMRLLPRGGYLATASCSHFMPAERFERMLRSAAADAGVELRQIEARTQSCDHPILWNVPETDYLKFYLFQVV